MTGLRYSPLHVTELCEEMQGNFKVGCARLIKITTTRRHNFGQSEHLSRITIPLAAGCLREKNTHLERLDELQM